MSSTHHVHAYLRTSPPPVKRISARPSRSAPLSKTSVSTRATVKSIKGAKGKSIKEDEQKRNDDISLIDEDDDMGSSFLQYCAMCEKQIIVPNNAILYCSESCRRRDASLGPSAIPYLSLFNPSFQLYATGDDCDESLGSTLRNSSRRQQPLAPLPSTRIPPFAHEGKSDLDPSEWKPNLPHRSSSEAFLFLSQFHRSSATLTPTRRPTLQSRSTVASVAITTPSLSHTPTTSASSDESLAGTPYEFTTRPLLPRLDPKHSTSAGTKSVDLVTPHIPSAFSVPNDIATDVKSAPKIKRNGWDNMTAGDVTFEKKWVVGSIGPAAGSLKKLLEMGKLGPAVKTNS